MSRHYKLSEQDHTKGLDITLKLVRARDVNRHRFPQQFQEAIAKAESALENARKEGYVDLATKYASKFARFYSHSSHSSNLAYDKV